VSSEETIELEVGEDGRRVIVRSLESQDDYQQCQELESEIWGAAIAVPAALMMVSQKVGGVTAGAFDEDGRMLGMVYGLTGPCEGRLVHWSHMLAVREEVRGLGLGRQLKLFQRDLVRALGAESMLWSFDPLEAKNAHLNINRLGALPVEYLEDLYGEPESRLHEGLGTDRFVVEWELAGTATRPEVEDGAWEAAPIVNVTAEGDPLAGGFELPDAPAVRMEVPFDVQRVKAASAGAGAVWRACTRRTVQGYFERGYRVVAFRREMSSDRCFYLLRGGGWR
jgi:predicted GNAT superfamily acetyltransferase